MKRITTIALFASLAFPIFASHIVIPPDTTFRYNDKMIVVSDGDNETTVSVFQVYHKHGENDTINMDVIYEGVFGQDIAIERQYDNRFEISIPEVFRPKKSKQFNPHWGGFGVGFTNLPSGMGFDGELSSVITPSSSMQYNLNFGVVTFDIGLSNMRIVSGMGIQFNSIHMQNNKALEVQDYKTVITTAEEGVYYNTSRLHFTNLTIPLLLEYNNPSRKGFFINGGLVGKIKTASSSKIWFHDEGKKRKMKMPGNLNIRPVSFDFIVQAGFGSVGAFATYSPIDLFMRNKGPVGNQVSVGLQFYFL